MLVTPHDAHTLRRDSDQESAKRVVDLLEREALTMSPSAAVYFRRLADGIREDFFPA